MPSTGLYTLIIFEEKALIEETESVELICKYRKRAKYGAEIIKKLAKELSAEVVIVVTLCSKNLTAINL